MVLQKRTVLHVDDDPAVTRLVASKLNKRGFDVVSLNDPALALNEIATNQIRVVVCDIDMPSPGGLKLLQAIKRYDGGTQVIMLTGLVTMTSILQSLRYGAEACLFKPLVDVVPLADALDDAFRKLDRWWTTLEELAERRRHDHPVVAP